MGVVVKNKGMMGRGIWGIVCIILVNEILLVGSMMGIEGDGLF